MAALDSSFPKKGDEENKISVDIINDDQALAAEFEKMTDAEESAILVGEYDLETDTFSKKNSLGEAFDTTSASSGQITRRAETRIENEVDLDKQISELKAKREIEVPEKKEKKSLINSIGSAFSSISAKLETNIGKVLEDPKKRALFYAGTDMIDKASRITPISSGRAQSPFGIVTSSLGGGVKKVKAEELAAATAKSKAGASSYKNQIDMLKLKNELDKPGAMELDAYKGLDKQMEDIASATKLNQVFGSQKNLIKAWVADPGNKSLPVGALRSKFPGVIQAINDLLPLSMRRDSKFFQSIESSANFINSFNKLAVVATLDTLANTKLTPVSDTDVTIVRSGQTQTTDAASSFLTNIVFTDAISLIESEKLAYARLFKRDRGYKKGSDRDFNTEFNTEGALKIRNKILKESSYSPDQIYEEAKILGFESDYEKYTGDVTDFSPFALASAKASLDMGGKSSYQRFYNSQIPIDKDKNITTTGTGEPLDGDSWQEKYPGLDKKIQDLENNKKTN